LKNVGNRRLTYLVLIIFLFIISSVAISAYMSLAKRKELNYSTLTYSIPGPVLLFLETGNGNLKSILYDDGRLVIDVVSCRENHCLVNIILSLNKGAKVFHALAKLSLNDNIVYSVDGEPLGKWVFSLQDLRAKSGFFRNCLILAINYYGKTIYGNCLFSENSLKVIPSKPIIIETDESKVELETQYEYDLSSKLLKRVSLRFVSDILLNMFKIPYLDFIGEMSLESYSIAKPLKLRIDLNTAVFNVEEAYLTLSSEIYLKYSSEISGELILKGENYTSKYTVRKGIGYALLSINKPLTTPSGKYVIILKDSNGKEVSKAEISLGKAEIAIKEVRIVANKNRGKYISMEVLNFGTLPTYLSKVHIKFDKKYSVVIETRRIPLKPEGITYLRLQLPKGLVPEEVGSLNITLINDLGEQLLSKNIILQS